MAVDMSAFKLSEQSKGWRGGSGCGLVHVSVYFSHASILRTVDPRDDEHHDRNNACDQRKSRQGRP